jgi:signal transduction histidine kinase
LSEVTLSEFARSSVVVVDDNLPSAQLVQSLLGHSGLRTVHAIHESREVLDRCAELNPDLILLDLHMPGMDGYAVLAELRRRATPTDLPVLVLTADTTRDATRRALELGANDFLTKPLDAAELVLRVRNLLDGRASHAGLQRRQRWLEASGQLARELLSGESIQPLHRVSELACEAAEADLVVIARPRHAPDDDAPTTITVGDRSVVAPSVVARAFSSGTTDPDAPLLLVQLVGSDGPDGAMLLCRHAGRPRFGETDVALATTFASQAALAVEYAEARADRERIAVLADRHRIARDLHDHVIQRLFATGLRLQQLASRSGPGPVSERIEMHAGELDDTIAEIRSTIFGLRQPIRPGPERLPRRLVELTAELAEILGFEPQLQLAPSLDAVPEEIARDVLAAVREAITNVARHASASQAEVSVTVTDSDVVLEVRDDGVGIGAAGRRSGLTNLAERATNHGGSCRVTAMSDGGTLVVWTVPLADAHRSAAIPIR